MVCLFQDYGTDYEDDDYFDPDDYLSNLIDDGEVCERYDFNETS